MKLNTTQLLFAISCTFSFLSSVALAANHVRGKDAASYLIAGGKGKAKLLLNQNNGSDKASMSLLALGPSSEVPTHLHENSAEYLYITQGEVEIVIGKQKLEARAGDAVYIPANMKHSAKVGPAGYVEAVQIYVGPGPEQRFTEGEKFTDD